jgi:translocation and assembly module TamB
VKLNRINKVILLFLGVVALMSWSIWQAVQTERFGSFVSKRVTSYVKKNWGHEFAFEHLDFEVFPPRTNFYNVRLKNIREDKEVELIEGFLVIPKRKNKKRQKLDLDKINLFETYKNNILKELPFILRTASLRSFKIWIDQSTQIDIVELDAGLYKNLLVSEGIIGASFNQQKHLKDLSNLEVQFDFQLDKKSLRFKELVASEGFNKIRIQGVSENLKIRNADVKGVLNLSRFKKYISDPDILQLYPKGFVKLSGKIRGKIDDISGEVKLVGRHIESKFLQAKKMTAFLVRKEKLVNLMKSNIYLQRGEVELSEPVTVFNIEKKDFIYPRMKILTKNAYSNDLLFFVPALRDLKFFASGNFDLDFLEDELILRAKENSQINKMKLLTNDGGLILAQESAKIQNSSEIKVDYKGPVTLDLNLSFPDSNILASGTIKDGEVDVNLRNSFINLKEMGPLSGFQMYGRGSFDARFFGPYKNVTLEAYPKFQNFSFLDIDYGNVEGSFTYGIETGVLTIPELRAINRELEYRTYGVIKFKEEKDNLNVKTEIKHGKFSTLKRMLKPIFSPLEKYLKFSDFFFSGNVDLSGPFDAKKMGAKGRIKGQRGSILSEKIDLLNLDFNYKDEKIDLNNINIRKASGKLIGKYSFDLASDTFEYSAKLSDLKLTDIKWYRMFNLGYEGVLQGDFYGGGEVKRFTTRNHLKVENGSIETLSVNDSVITIYNNAKDLFASANLFGDMAIFESYLSLDKEKVNKKSFVSGEIKFSDIKPLFGLLSGHNIEDRALEGNLFGDFNFKFNLQDYEKFDLDLNVKELEFARKDIKVFRKNMRVYVEEGAIKNWDMNLSGEGVWLNSTATGEFDKSFSQKNRFKVNASVIELFTDKIEKALGTVYGDMSLERWNGGQFKKKSSVSTSGMALKVVKLPGLIRNINLHSEALDDDVFIRNAVGDYGNGKFKMTGGFKLKFPFPVFNLGIDLEKVRIPYQKRSGFVSNGKLTLTGNKVPYSLSGGVDVIYGEVLEEMNDMAKSAIEDESYSRFLPADYLGKNVALIQNQIDVTFSKPLMVKNNMIDLNLNGRCKIYGSLTGPRVVGEFNLGDRSSKFMFKGHDFYLSEGRIIFPEDWNQSPNLRFRGSAKINEYDVSLKVDGPAKIMTVEMTSNPPLVQEDILSLLTLGVTSDISKSLGERDRQSVTTLSIGTLIFDQLKINKSLNDSLGMRLSIQPEYSEDESSLLESESDEGKSSAKRYKSTTKIKLQKNINKKVGLTFSSTVGGTIEQKQEMNVNYNLNKNLSFDGLYEINFNDDVETKTPDSIGADIKYQWSF